MKKRSFAVEYFTRWNGFCNLYDYEEFETYEEAKKFANSHYDTTIYKIVESPYKNSGTMYEFLEK